MKISTRKYILDPGNLRKAILKSYRAKTARQRSKKEVVDVMANFDQFIEQTIKEHRDGTYKVGEYRHFVIHDKKDRNVSVLPYKDRCVLNLVKDAIEPIILNHLTDDMYGGLPKRGVVTKKNNRSVIRRIRKILRTQGHEWYWMGDIAKFYDTLKNPVIMQRIERILNDPFTIGLIRQFVWAQPSLAIGDPFSHLLANLCMSDLIRYIKEQIPQVEIVNFADNILIFAADKKTATMAGKSARSFAATQLRLHFHRGDHVAPVTSEGIHFCGRVYYPNGKVFLRKIQKKTLQDEKINLCQLHLIREFFVQLIVNN